MSLKMQLRPHSTCGLKNALKTINNNNNNRGALNTAKVMNYVNLKSDVNII